jgi:hypothetical protein
VPPGKRLSCVSSSIITRVRAKQVPHSRRAVSRAEPQKMPNPRVPGWQSRRHRRIETLQPNSRIHQSLRGSLAPRRAPPDPFELADSRSGHRYALRDEQRSFQQLVPSVPAEPSTSGDDTVTRHVAPAASAHDVADGARGSRAPGERRDVAVGGDLSRWNPPHDRQDPARKGRRRHRDRFYMSVSGSIPNSAGSSGLTMDIACAPSSPASHRLRS